MLYILDLYLGIVRLSVLLLSSNDRDQFFFYKDGVYELCLARSMVMCCSPPAERDILAALLYPVRPLDGRGFTLTKKVK